MNLGNTLKTATAVAVLAIIVLPAPAHAAYIDPLSGSLILQALLAGLLAVAFRARRALFRVSTFVRNVWTRIQP